MHKVQWVILTLLIVVFSASAGTITRSFNFQPVDVQRDGNYDILTGQGMLTYGEPGEPALPIFAHTLLLLPGEAIKDIQLVGQKWEVLKDVSVPRPGSQILPLSSEKEAYFIENSEIYNGSKVFPEQIVHDIQTGYLRGHALGSFLITTVRWNPATGITEQLVEATVEIMTEIDQQAQDALQLLRSDKKTHKMLSDITSDLDNLGFYDQRNDGINELDEVMPSLLIICSELHLEAWEDYAAYKRNRGMETIIMTTQDIYDSFEGVDNAQKVQNAIFFQYITNWIEHVLLGGDVQYVPYRHLYATANDEGDQIPSDLYYAGLDATWNSDNDEFWGEPNESDLYQELTVGRASITSVNMAESWIAKQISYQSEPVAEEVTQAMMVGEDLGWTCWGGEYKDEVRYGSSNYGYTTAGFPEQFAVGDLYDMNNVWNIATLFNRLSSGVHLVNHLGHANTNYALKAENNDISNQTLTNNGENHGYYMIYTQGCYCGNFEEESIMEKWTTIDNGAFATIANSRYGWGSGGDTNGPSQRFDRQFFDAMFDEDLYRIGEVNRDSKHDNVPYINQNCMRWCYYEITLFGDPTVDMYTDWVQDQTVDVSDVYIIGSPGIEVDTDGIAAAVVAVSRDGELLATAETDVDGYVLVPLDVNEMGELHISVVAHNYFEYETDIMAISPAGGYPVVEDITINDIVTGNGNGQADFSENILVEFQVRNFGQAEIAQLTFEASTESPWISIDDTILMENNLLPEESVQFTLIADIDTDVPDHTEAIINMHLVCDTSQVSSDYNLILHAPELAISNVIVDDTEFGNGNLRIEPGETVALSMDIVNNGSADLMAAAFTSRSNDPIVEEIQTGDDPLDFVSGQSVGLNNIVTFTVPEDAANPSRSWLLCELIREDGFRYGSFVPLEIGGFFENAEGADQGLTHYQITGGDQWHISNERNYSIGGSNSWKIGDVFGEYAHNMEACLELPPLERNYDFILTFNHWMDAEDSGQNPGECYDGGFIELSGDGENWMTLPMQTYTHTTRGDGPLGAGQRVFSGQFDWRQETVNISRGPGFAYLRFHFGSDRGIAGEGWYIDDIKVFMRDSNDPALELSGEYADGIVNLQWRTPATEIDEELELLGFNVYRDDQVIADLLSDCSYQDHLSGFPVDTYSYYVTAVYNTGESVPCDPINVEFDGFAVENNPDIPFEWSVSKAYPNPFNPTITVPFTVPNTGQVQFAVYNVLGQKVFEQARTYQTGFHRFVFDGTDLVSGVYFMKLSFGNDFDSQKILLIK